MSGSYIAVLRLGEDGSRRAVVSRFAEAIEDLGGVQSVDLDLAGRCLLVWFDRARVTLADLVRTVEDQGGWVSGVAQTRAVTAAIAAIA
ncbi:MAG: heavy-metal-associated domain-containing protein [Phycisphaerales bacterium]|nr:heavy-metal-associated domain-containing protein [Phycisphaerales bacterium]